MSGARRHLVTLQTRTDTADSYGDAVASYTTLGTAWAEITMMTGRERFDAQQVQAESTHKLVIPYCTEHAVLAENDRVTYDGRTFDITYVGDPDGRARDILIVAQERN